MAWSEIKEGSIGIKPQEDWSIPTPSEGCALTLHINGQPVGKTIPAGTLKAGDTLLVSFTNYARHPDEMARACAAADDALAKSNATPLFTRSNKATTQFTREALQRGVGQVMAALDRGYIPLPQQIAYHRVCPDRCGRTVEIGRLCECEEHAIDVSSRLSDARLTRTAERSKSQLWRRVARAELLARMEASKPQPPDIRDEWDNLPDAEPEGIVVRGGR